MNVNNYRIMVLTYQGTFIVKAVWKVVEQSKMQIDLFGLKLGKNENPLSGKSYTKYEIPLEELQSKLNINGKITFVQYNINTRKLHITEEQV